MTIYRGCRSLSVREGQCWTDDPDAAEEYATAAGLLARAELAAELVIEDCEGYDHDNNWAPADDPTFRAAAAARGVDVLRYEDCAESGTEHTCYRLVSERAVASLTPQQV